MKMRRHAEVALVAMGSRMPVPASVIIERLKNEPAPKTSTAIEVCRLQFAVGTDRSNGDSVVVIVRKGTVMTAMLRRSWSQPFDPKHLRVQQVQSWHKEVAA